MPTAQEVQATIAVYIAEAMYMDVDEIGEDDLFSSFGLESATLAKIVARINSRYGREIEVREVIPHQTLREAAAFIHEKLDATAVANGARQ